MVCILRERNSHKILYNRLLHFLQIPVVGSHVASHPAEGYNILKIVELIAILLFRSIICYNCSVYSR